MIILDENIAESQRAILIKQGLNVKQIGFDLKYKGIKDEELMIFFHTLKKPTFISWDRGLYRKKICHKNYCIAYLDVREDEIAIFAKKLLKDKRFNVKAKRMGKIIKLTSMKIKFWEINKDKEQHLSW